MKAKIKINIGPVIQWIVGKFKKRKNVYPRKFLLKKDPLDNRDYYFKLRAIQNIPESLDLSDKIGWVYDQGNLGSCTGQGVASAFRFSLVANKQPDMEPSRLFIYYNGRTNKQNDTGACIRDVIKGVVKFGVCPENEWPYIENQFNIKPSDKLYQDAEKHQALRYEKVRQNSTFIKSVISSGFPIVLGITVFDSIMSDEVAKTGILNMPSLKDKCLGGHCIFLVGYKPGYFKILNSWGAKWGQNGYFWVPEEYITTDLAHDLWVIYQTE